MAQVAVPLSLTDQGLLFIGTRTVNFFDLWLDFKGGVPTSFLLMSGYWLLGCRHVSANRAMNISAICFKVHTDSEGGTTQPLCLRVSWEIGPVTMDSWTMLSHANKAPQMSFGITGTVIYVKVGELIFIWKKASFIVPWIRRLVCQSRAGRVFIEQLCSSNHCGHDYVRLIVYRGRLEMIYEDRWRWI